MGAIGCLNVVGVAAHQFAAPRQIVFGWGRRCEVGHLARSLGRRAFVVHGSATLETNGTMGQIGRWLTEAGVEHVPLADLRHEPTAEIVDAAAELLRSQGPQRGDLVVAVGGGSALDFGKAVAAMSVQPPGTGVRDYLEGVGRGLTLTAAPLPVLAMPTTGGTGSEATKNAVLSVAGVAAKKSLRADGMLPRLVLVDPELSASVPPRVTAHTGMDAITQLIESYVSRRAQPLTQALAVEGLRHALPAVELAYGEGMSRPARESMSYAALLSGMALANSGLGLAHGVAAALGSLCNVPHGLACAVMLPAALEVNRTVATRSLATLARQALGVTEQEDGRAADRLVASIERLCTVLEIPRRLSAIGVRAEQVADLVPASRGNSMSGNPRELADDELRQLLEAML